jgi:hypothetical protein
MTEVSSLHRALGYLSLRWKDPSRCEACGNEFTCGATITGCWCMKVTVSKETRTRLRGRYKNCLCRACLEREAAR